MIMLRLHLVLLFVLSLITVWFLSDVKTSPQPSAHGFLLVVNKGEQTLGVVDPTSGKQVAAVPEGGITGHEVASSPDGKFAYVPIYGKSGVGTPGTAGHNMVVIDIAAPKVVANVDLVRGGA